MMVVSTVCQEVVARVTCEPYLRRAVMTSSMRGHIGLLGYPDLLKLGMIPPSFPFINTHKCVVRVDLAEGCFLVNCGEVKFLGEAAVGKVIMGSDVRMEELGNVPEELLCQPLQAQLCLVLAGLGHGRV